MTDLDLKYCGNGTSVLKRSSLSAHVLSTSENASPSDHATAFEETAKAFQAESAQILSLSPMDADPQTVRFELIRPLIIKVLLYLDLKLDICSLAAIARIIESLAVHSETDLNALSEGLAKYWDTTPKTILKLLEKTFNVYDPVLTERISSLTCTTPFTFRDAVYDLAVYVKTKYLHGSYNARPNK